VHKRYRRQTDGRVIAYSEREFKFVKNRQKTHLFDLIASGILLKLIILLMHKETMPLLSRVWSWIKKYKTRPPVRIRAVCFHQYFGWLLRATSVGTSCI